MRFSLQPEQRPEPRMCSLSIDEILSLAERDPGTRPPLENYFSPTKKETFTKDYLHHLNTGLLDAKHGKLGSDQYLVFVLSFQFTAPLLKSSHKMIFFPRKNCFCVFLPGESFPLQPQGTS